MSWSKSNSTRWAMWGGGAAVAATVCAAAGLAWQVHSAHPRSTREALGLARALVTGSCPAGYATLEDEGAEHRDGAVERDGMCALRRHPESGGLAEANDAFAQRHGQVPPAAYRAGLARKQAMLASGAQAKVSGASGQWVPYQSSPVIVNDPRYTEVSGEGLVKVSGRVDSFAYDPAGKRLFATIGTGGVWMTSDLGEHWVSVGESLPTQVVGSVGWSSANGGTLIVGSGEPTFGSSAHSGLGAFWSADLGQTWHQSTGIPDGLLTFKVEVDGSNAAVVYIATDRGLFRSADAGHSFVNVQLPVGSVTDNKGKTVNCAGDTGTDACQFANVITDVVVQAPGGTTSEAGGRVLAAVGYEMGIKDTTEGTYQRSPGNGLYASDTGAAGSFAQLTTIYGNGATPNGFATQERIGRVALGQALGDQQNHNFVYALVQDAVQLAGGTPYIDIPAVDSVTAKLPLPLVSSSFNGLYVSGDFGKTWTRLTDYANVVENPSTGSSLALVEASLGYAPGVQAWYNLVVKPDPTLQDGSGVPERVTFGLEEVWQNKTLVAQGGAAAAANELNYGVIGTYYSDATCLALNIGAIIPGVTLCPFRNPADSTTTTHPDQHALIYVPDGSGGVYLFVGDDGGVYRQHVAAGGTMDNAGWGEGNDAGFNTTLPYAISVAKDGTVWWGLQDNGSGYIDPSTNIPYMTFGGDGFYNQVDPDNSQLAYIEYASAAMYRSSDGGQNWTSIQPSQLTAAQFSNPFAMDPTNAKHLMTGGSEIVETLDAPNVTTSNWVQVYDLGKDAYGAGRQVSAVSLIGDAAYVGFCGACYVNHLPQSHPVATGIATNVNGDKAPQAGTSDGWHIAKLAGLPVRTITSIAIDPADTKTLYVTLSGYNGVDWAPPGSYLDGNTNIGSGHVFVSHDAGDSFTDISGDLPQTYAEAVILIGSQLAVGTDLGPYISSDLSGAHWVPLGNGMPNVPVDDLKLQPGSPNVLFAATYGRGVWRYSLTSGGGSSSGSGSSSSGAGGSSSGSGSSSSGGSSGGSGHSSGSGGGAFAPPLLLPLLLLGAARRRRRRG